MRKYFYKPKVSENTSVRVKSGTLEHLICSAQYRGGGGGIERLCDAEIINKNIQRIIIKIISQ